VRSYLETVGDFHVGDMVNKFGRGSLVMLPSEEGGGYWGALAAGASEAESAGVSAAPAPAAKRARRAGPDDGAGAEAGGGGGGSGAAGGHGAAPRPQLVFGTVGGAVGALISLPPQLYRYLLTLQRALLQVLSSVGGLSHSVWRSWYSDRRQPNTLVVGAFPPAPRGFIDGDVVEVLLELERGVQERVVSAMNELRGVSLAEECEATLHPWGVSAADATVEEAVRVVEHLARLH